MAWIAIDVAVFDDLNELECAGVGGWRSDARRPPRLADGRREIARSRIGVDRAWRQAAVWQPDTRTTGGGTARGDDSGGIGAR